MKRTEKSIANCRQKSKANSRQEQSQREARQEQSQQQAREDHGQQSRQSEPKDCDRDKAKYDEKHTTEERYSQPVPKHPRTDADAQQGQNELKLAEVITTTPKIDFNMESVEYKNLSFTVQKDIEVIHGEVKG